MHRSDVDFYGTEGKIPEGICPLDTHMCGWENNMKVNVTSSIMYLCGMDYLAPNKEI
jgi:hypothetical protein